MYILVAVKMGSSFHVLILNLPFVSLSIPRGNLNWRLTTCVGSEHMSSSVHLGIDSGLSEAVTK